MRNLLVWIAVGLSWVTTVSGQQVELRQTKEVISIEQLENKRTDLKAYRAQGDYYLSIQFDQLPNKRQQQRLQANGIELISYRKGTTYLAKVPEKLSGSELAKLGIQKIKTEPTSAKIGKDILEQSAPDWAIPQYGWLDISVGLTSVNQVNTVKKLLGRLGAELLKGELNKGQILFARIPQNKVQSFAASPLVTFIDVIQEPDQALNHEVRTIQRVNLLNSGYNGVPGLNGAGVAIGVGDGGQLGDHIDFDNRVINKANGTYSSFGSHGDHVSGIIGGAGHINPRNRGIASEANILTQKTSLITYYAEDYYNEHGMVLTNNSYGTSFNCATNGSYNYSSLTLDKQLRDLPEMLHIFAAGNSGGNTCPDYAQGYHTVLRYYQAAKNVLTVGNTNKDRTIRSNSSRGPVADGRVKPELVAVGSNVVSTGRDFNYFASSGTSMASPAVAATLALMYERYRQLNNGDNPRGELVKAVSCNTAEDLGMPGPDYIFGYGLINGRRAIDVINNQQYQSGEINQGEQNIHTITVPAGVKQVKAMLYWHDKEAEAFAEKALVNDLDLTLIDPAAQSYLPWVLDHDPAKVHYPATRKVDTLNNIEQVTLDDPAQGVYQIVVDGSDIPFGAQSYVIVYDFIEEELMLTFPSGGETLTPGTQEYIQWDTDITNYEEFTIEYSANGGQSWEILEDGLGDSDRHFVWTVPNEVTQNGLLRITKNGGNDLSSQNQIPFNIIEAPTALEAEPYCNGLVGLSWQGIEGSDITYKVSIFDGEQMTELATVVDTNYIVREELITGKKYWFSVNAVLDQITNSERAVATFCVPDPDLLCPWTNDPQMIMAQTTERGRYNTNSSLGDNENVNVVVRNVGTNSIDSVLVSYQINNLPIVSEWVKEPIASGDTLFYEFIQKADLSEVGTHSINTWVNLPDDSNLTNDSLINQNFSIQLPNDQVQLPFGSDFVNAEELTYTTMTIGLEGARSLDFEPLENGKLVVQQGAFFLLPEDQADTSNITNDLILTVDMTDYLNRTPVLVMHFDYYSLETGIGPLSQVKRDPSTVWIRGSDMDEWVLLVELSNEENWASERNIKIKEALENAGQSLSASTQIRFRQSDSFGLALSDLVVEEIFALPVEWENFQAQAISNGQVSLTWITSNEDQNDFFEIKAAYLTDGKEGLPVYQTIATIDSRANGSTRQYYQYTDRQPFSEKVLYKIQQVDTDQNSSESPIRAVHIDQPIRGELNVYPNPFDGHINITTAPDFGNVQIVRLLDTQGKTLFLHENTTTNRTISLNVPNIPAGYYFIELLGDKGISRHKIVKQ